jgi:hypothetical protein
MERIAIDMDGVLADVAEQFFKYDDERDFGKRKAGRSSRYDRTGCIPRSREYVYSKGFSERPRMEISKKEVVSAE